MANSKLGYGEFCENKTYYVVQNLAGECLCKVLPGFRRDGVDPEWDHEDFAFRFNLSHAETQKNLLAWDYKQKSKIIRKTRK